MVEQGNRLTTIRGKRPSSRDRCFLQDDPGWVRTRIRYGCRDTPVTGLEFAIHRPHQTVRRRCFRSITDRIIKWQQFDTNVTSQRSSSFRSQLELDRVGPQRQFDGVVQQRPCNQVHLIRSLHTSESTARWIDRHCLRCKRKIEFRGIHRVGRNVDHWINSSKCVCNSGTQTGGNGSRCVTDRIHENCHGSILGLWIVDIQQLKRGTLSRIRKAENITHGNIRDGDCQGSSHTLNNLEIVKIVGP